MKLKSILIPFLWIVAAFFAYKIYHSINAPIRFNKIKNERYKKVINNLKDIKKAQIAYRDVRGVFSNNFDSLISFIEKDQFILVEKRDSSYMKYNKVYRIDMLEEVIVVDTLGFISVKDSLFKNTERYKSMQYVPVEGMEDSTFQIKANVIVKNGYRVPVFEVKVSKDIVLFDQDKDLLKQEKGLVSVDGINGPEIILGSLSDVSTNGNWPTIFDAVQ